MRRISILLVLLLTPVLFTACPSKKDTNTTENKVKPKKVDYMAETKPVDNRMTVSTFSEISGKAVSVSNLKLFVGPSKAGKVVVDIKTEAKNDTKPQPSSKASVWISVFNSTLLVGKDANSYEFKVSGNWNIDNRASEAILASSMMAALTGAKLKNDVMITGTINPDGTIGPVKDLPAKLEAAIKAGKKEFGYPAGQVNAWDSSVNNFVNLEETAKKAGIKLVAIDTLYNAFYLVTGKVIDLPKVIGVDEMKLSKELSGQLTGLAGNWHKIYKDYSKKYKKVRTRPSKKTANWKKIADKYYSSSKDLLKKGEISPAYDYAQRGGAFAFTSYWSKRFDRLDKKKNLKGMLKAIAEFKSEFKKITESIESLKRIKPESRGDLLALVSAMEQSSGAWSFMTAGMRLTLKAVDKINYLLKKKLAPSLDQGRLYKLLDNSILKFSMATLKNQKALDFSKFVGGKGAKFIIQPEKFKKLAGFLTIVSIAHLSFVKQLFIVEDIAKTGVKKEKIQEHLINTNNNYLQAMYGLKYAMNAAKGNDFQDALGIIAADSGILFNSSMLYMKYVSLEITKNAKGGDINVKRKKVLDAMLKAAEKNVLQQAALSKKYSGVVPASAKFFYNIGISMKNQTWGLKVKALEMFWKASLECQLSILMAQ